MAEKEGGFSFEVHARFSNNDEYGPDYMATTASEDRELALKEAMRYVAAYRLEGYARIIVYEVTYEAVYNEGVLVPDD